MKRPTAAARRPLPGSPFATPAPRPLEHFSVRDRVSHDRYGLGSVISVEEEVAVVVDFGSRQLRIPAPYTKLNKL